MNYRTGCRPIVILIASLMLLFLIAIPAWADECQDAERALAIAEADLALLHQVYRQAEDEYGDIYRAEAATRQALEEARRANRLAILEYRVAHDLWVSAYQNTTYGSELFNTEAWQVYQRALAAKDQALVNKNAAFTALNQANMDFNDAWDAFMQILARINEATRAWLDQLQVVKDARQRLEEACESETEELENLLDKFGMNDGPDVIREYAGRANEANTEDIAIERARRLGLDGQGAGGGVGGMGGGSPANFCTPGSAGCSTLNFKVVDSSQPGNSTSYNLGGTTVATGLSSTQEQTIVIGVPTGTPLTLTIACAGTNNAGAVSCVTSIIVNSGGACTNNVTTTALNATNTTTTCTGT